MHRTSLSVALLLLAAAWYGPLPQAAVGSFAAHMTLHMIVVAVVSPFVAMAVAGSRFDPAAVAPGLFAAIPASLVELAVVWTWHAPALHHAARQHTGMFVAEQASFLAAGLFLWIAALGGPPEDRTRRAGSGIVALALTFAHMTLLGALLALTPRPLYRHADVSPAAAALADQQLGGAIMLVVGASAYIGGGLWLGRRLLGKAQPT